MVLDKIHYNFTSIDGCDKPFNFIISARDDGKTTSFVMQKSYPAWKKRGQTTIVLKRLITDITEEAIESYKKILNKFGIPMKLRYSKKELESGVVNVFAREGDGEESLWLKFIAINKRTDNLKGLFIENPAYMFLDELILQPHSKQDKYVWKEAWKVNELYNTYSRENRRLKFYACGNPYTLYNPYFVQFGIDPAKLKLGSIQTGAIWAVERHKLHPDLVAFLKANNPLYDENAGDAFANYAKYALEGLAVGDSAVKICKKRPENFRLMCCFRYEDAFIGVYHGKHENMDYWAGQIKDEGTRRKVFAFSFKDLLDGSCLLSIADKILFTDLRMAIANRRIAFDGVESNYEMEEIYKHL